MIEMARKWVKQLAGLLKPTIRRNTIAHDQVLVPLTKSNYEQLITLLHAIAESRATVHSIPSIPSICRYRVSIRIRT